MKVYLAKNAGFCMGVKRAVDTALMPENKGAYILGNIIHNETVLNEISKKGLITVESESEVESGKTVIIRSHGVGKAVFDYFNKNNIKVIDCTCPFVKKIQSIVEEYYLKGFQIVIVGKSNHPEVIGINGWCDNSAIILDGEEDACKLDGLEKVCIVSQTTYSLQKFENILKKISNLSLKTVEIFKTICYTTMERQSEAEMLSKKCDAMVVIGGTTSSNTARLYDICKKNCSATCLVSKPDGLDYKKLKNYNSVGIVSGASTPLEQSMEVFLSMESKEVNSMEQALAMLDEKQNLKKGKIISVVISQVLDGELKVYFDGKTDITISKDELAAEVFNKDDYKEGDEIKVVVMATKPLRISQKQILVIEKEQALAEELKQGKIVNVAITASNKGGLIGKFENFDVFVPAREIKIGFVKELDKYIGKNLRVKALKVECNNRKKEIVASQKVILEEEKAARDAERLKKEEEFFANIAENDIVTGTVARFSNFGAFVVVNGFDCLAHISDLSWNNVKVPQEVLELNKAYDFVVLKVDKENKKVSIGYKQLQPKPWDLVEEKYAVGDTVKGKVVRIVNFGAFVELEKGIDGLVHVSQISYDFLENPATALKVGDEVDAKIMAIDVEKKKITLSIKALLTPPVKEEKVEEEKGKKDKKVKNEDEEMRNWTDAEDTGISIAELLNK